MSKTILFFFKNSISLPNNAKKGEKKKKEWKKKFQNNPSITRSLCRLECAARDNYETRRAKRTDVETQPDRIGRNGGRDIDRDGYAVIGGTCLSILQSIIERHCHVNGNRIEIGMEMATRTAAVRYYFRFLVHPRDLGVDRNEKSIRAPPSVCIFSLVVPWYPSGGVSMN